MGRTAVRGRLGVLVVCALIAGPRTARAQAFGTGSQTTVIPAAAFQPERSSEQWNSAFGVTLTPSASVDTRFVAPLGLPNGAVIDRIDLLVSDSDVTLDISASLVFYGHPLSGSSATCGPGTFWTGTTSGLSGGGLLTLTGTPIQVNARGFCGSGPDDAYLQYYLEVVMLSTSHSLSGAAVKWHRSLSPAPGTATFSDVPTSDPFFRAVEAFAASGITSGCGGGHFCPNDVVTRAQIAKFFAVALGLHWTQ